jgi:hypothetical protein
MTAAPIAPHTAAAPLASLARPAASSLELAVRLPLVEPLLALGDHGLRLSTTADNRSRRSSGGAIRWRRAMTRLPLLSLAVPFACLALLSLVAFLGVVALAGALHLVGAIRSGLGIAVRSSVDGDPWHGMVGDAHPLDYIEGPR